MGCSDMAGEPPPDVAAAAARVQEWLASQAQQRAQPQVQAPVRVSEDQFAKMTPSERIDYCRQFPQALPTGKRS